MLSCKIQFSYKYQSELYKKHTITKQKSRFFFKLAQKLFFFLKIKLKTYTKKKKSQKVKRNKTKARSSHTEAHAPHEAHYLMSTSRPQLECGKEKSGKIKTSAHQEVLIKFNSHVY